MDIKFILAVALDGLGLLLDIVGLAIPYWAYLSEQGATINAGLWKLCQDPPDICADYVDSLIPDSLKATRALVILGLLLAAGALVCFLLRQFLLKDKGILNKIAAGIAVGAGIFMIIGAIIYATDKDLYTGLDLHAGFALAIVAGVFCIAGGVFMFLSPSE